MRSFVAGLCLGMAAGIPPAAARPVPGGVVTEPLVVAVEGGTVEVMLDLKGALFQRLTETGEIQDASRKDLRIYLRRRDGAWADAVAVDAPGYNQGSHAGSLTGHDGLNRLDLAVRLGEDRWIPGDPEARFTVRGLAVADDVVTGTFEGRFRGQAVAGEVSGIAQSAGWRGAEVDGQEVKVSLDMGTRRVNWNHARWAAAYLGGRRDWSAWDGVMVTVATDTPRHDAWVDFGIMEHDGSWYTVRNAVPLTRPVQTVVIDWDHLRHAEWIFDDRGTGPGASGNFDENFHFDRDQAARLAFGVVNPLGIGKVEFRILDLQLARWKSREPRTATVHATGELLSVNGSTEVPPGLFGFHTAGGDYRRLKDLRIGSIRPIRAMGYGGSFVTPPDPDHGVVLTVSCQYDRRQQLPQLTMANWEERTRAIGRSLGEQTRAHGRAAAVQWWNEPYIHLGPMVERDLIKVTSSEGAQAGDPVVLRGEPLESMVWVEQDGKLVPRDPTRFTYWSARQVGIFYNQSFLAMGTAAKEVNPEINLVGGFCFRWNEDEWAAWDLLYKPLLDEAAPLLDGIAEHHYQGYTDGMAAAYEVITAYADTEHGRRIPVYNTETNDLWDAPARGSAAAASQFGGVYKPVRRMVYNLRDILYCVQETPDKIASRAIHALWKGADGPAPGEEGHLPWAWMGIDQGEYHALHFLRELRGALIRTERSDSTVWGASSLDRVTESLVAVAFNDGSRPATVTLRADVPRGMQARTARLEVLGFGPDGAITSTSRELPAPDRDGASAEIDLPAHHAAKLVMGVAGPWPERPDVLREQHFAKGVVKRLAPGDTLELPLVKRGDTASPRRAWVRLVVERVGEGDGWMEIGGRRFGIPAAFTPSNGPAIREIPIDPDLAAAETITVGASPMPEGNGFLLGMASLVVEREP
jgi:hypothetical protein